MTEHSAQTPDFPNGSIDLNALHDAAIAGELGTTMPENVMLIGERELVDGEMLVDAGGDQAVRDRIDAATPDERAAMFAAAAPLVPVAITTDTTADPA